MAGGWIKLHRQITEWGWYKCNATRSVFIHLLLTANHKDGEVEGVAIKKGQKAASAQSLGLELGLSRQSVRTAFKHLISTNEITTKSAGKFTVITVVNYAKYQDFNSDKDEGDNQQSTSTSTNDLTSNQPAANQQLTTNKKGRREECKEVNNTTPPTPSREVPYEEIAKAYNDTCTLMPKANRITAARRRAMNARWRDYGKGELQPFISLFRRASQSAFLNGENDRGWYADFDWLLNESNLTKVLEGKYDRAIRASPGKPVTQQEENSRILRRMYEDAIREEQANGDNEGSDDPTLKPDKRGFSEQQVPDNRQPGEFVGSLPRTL